VLVNSVLSEATGEAHKKERPSLLSHRGNPSRCYGFYCCTDSIHGGWGSIGVDTMHYSYDAYSHTRAV
jgi:hypothetical protein